MAGGDDILNVLRGTTTPSPNPLVTPTPGATPIPNTPTPGVNPSITPTPILGNTPTPSPGTVTPYSPQQQQQVTALQRRVPASQAQLTGASDPRGWRRRVVSDAVTGREVVTPIDLANLFIQAPLGSGFWGRLLEDGLDENDMALIQQATGSDANVNASTILSNLTQTYASSYAPSATGTPTPPPQSAGYFGGTPTPGATPMLPPAQGSYSPTGVSGMGTPTPGPGSASALTTPPPDQPPIAGAGDYEDVARRADADAFALKNKPVLSGATVRSMPLGSGPGAAKQTVLVDDESGLVIGRYDEEKGKFTPSGDLNDEAVKAAIRRNSSAFDAADIVAVEKDRAQIVREAEKAAREQQESELNTQLSLIRIKQAQGELDVEAATREARVAIQNNAAAKAKIDLEAARLDLELKPLVKEQTELAIARARMEQQQAEQRFPLELEALQEQVATAREARMAREREARRQQAGDTFARQVYPGLLSMLMPQTNPTAGPPPVYNQLAENAGVNPNDPAAQMAFTVMQESLTGGSAV